MNFLLLIIAQRKGDINRYRIMVEVFISLNSMKNNLIDYVLMALKLTISHTLYY